MKTNPLGRPPRADLNTLLPHENAWVSIFCNLRNGLPARQEETRDSSGIFIKASYDQEKFFETTEDEIIEKGGRETLAVYLPGEQPSVTRQPKFIESPEERENWRIKALRIEEGSSQIAMGDQTRIVDIPGRPHERHLWEALKSADTAEQVKEICLSSRDWLKWRFEFPSGGFVDWSWCPYPIALYDHAAEFCRSKLNSRYPSRDKRASGDYRRIEYLARVMAGLSLAEPISSSYSIELFRKMNHPRECECWRCTIKVAPRYRTSLASFLLEANNGK